MMFCLVFLSAKTRPRAARARAEKEARVVLDVTSSAEHDRDPLDAQVRVWVWVYLPVPWWDAAGRLAQRRSFMISDGRASPTTFTALRPDLLLVTSTITCTVLFSRGGHAAPSASMARGMQRGEEPGARVGLWHLG